MRKGKGTKQQRIKTITAEKLKVKVSNTQSAAKSLKRQVKDTAHFAPAS